MPQSVFHFYQRKRVVNINVNILAAGVITIAIAKYPVYLIGEWIGSEHTVLLWVIAYVLDMIIDVAVYYVLHWVANHWNPSGRHPEHDARPKSRRFIQDATRIQAERAALVPLFMAVSLSMMWVLQKKFNVDHSWAFVFAFLGAMIVTRIVHTLWGFKTGTFRDHVDFVLDDDIQIGRDLSAKAETHAQSEADSSAEPKPQKTDEVAP